MIFEQEELDWEVYRLYGWSRRISRCHGGDLTSWLLGHRAFAIALAREVAAGTARRRGSITTTPTPMTGSGSWPADYRELVERRLG